MRSIRRAVNNAERQLSHHTSGCVRFEVRWAFSRPSGPPTCLCSVSVCWCCLRAAVLPVTSSCCVAPCTFFQLTQAAFWHEQSLLSLLPLPPSAAASWLVMLSCRVQPKISMHHPPFPRSCRSCAQSSVHVASQWFQAWSYIVYRVALIGSGSHLGFAQILLVLQWSAVMPGHVGLARLKRLQPLSNSWEALVLVSA